MTADTRLLLYALVAVITLIVLIARFKLHPFVALTTVSLAIGIAAGMPLESAVKPFKDRVHRRRWAHDPVRAHRRPSDRCARGPDLRRMGCAAHSASGGEQARRPAGGHGRA